MMKLILCSFLFFFIVGLNSSTVVAMDAKQAEKKPRPCLKRKSEALEDNNALQDKTNHAPESTREQKKPRLSFKRESSLVQTHFYEKGVEDNQGYENRWLQIKHNVETSDENERCNNNAGQLEKTGYDSDTEKTTSDSEMEEPDTADEHDEGIQKLLLENKEKNLALGNSDPEQVLALYAQKHSRASNEVLELAATESLLEAASFSFDSTELNERYEQTRLQALGALNTMGLFDSYDEM